jgi:pimeloyl-ACP methyl ester carboxylesterase
LRRPVRGSALAKPNSPPTHPPPLHPQGPVTFGYHRFGPLRPGITAANAALPPLVMLSGLGAYMYIHPIPLLQTNAADREVVIFDHQRLGASANDSSTGAVPLTVPLMAKSSADFIAALKVGSLEEGGGSGRLAARWARPRRRRASLVRGGGAAAAPRASTDFDTRRPRPGPHRPPPPQLPRKPDLYGWSLGGAVVAAMAALHSNAFRFGVIVNGWAGGRHSFVMPPPELKALRAARSNLTQVGAAACVKGGDGLRAGSGAIAGLEGARSCMAACLPASSAPCPHPHPPPPRPPAVPRVPLPRRRKGRGRVRAVRILELLLFRRAVEWGLGPGFEGLADALLALTGS